MTTQISPSLKVAANGYISEYGYECWELDALEPQVISSLIESNVVPYRDGHKYHNLLRLESMDKTLLNDISKNWGNVADNWTSIKENYC